MKFDANHRVLHAAMENLRSAHAERPTSRRAGELSHKGAVTFSSILSAARRVFEQEGYAGLSLRKVADEAGVATGNLNYYFSSKEALVEAMLREALGDFVAQHIAQLEDSPDDPLEALLDVIEFYIVDARRSHRLFMQIWGYAASGEKPLLLVREIYRPIGRLVLSLVEAARPDASRQEAREIVLQLFSLEEGVKLFIGLGPDDDQALARAEVHVRAVARRIIAGGRLRDVD